MSTSANNPIPLNFGSIYRSNYTYFMNVMLPWAYAHNPKTRVSAVLSESNETLIRTLFEIAFSQYKYLDIITINTNVTVQNNKTIENVTACAYNPFLKIGDKLHCRVLNETNASTEISLLWEYMRKRFENFYGHPLKVLNCQSDLK